MHRAEASLERGDAIGCRLDHELTLGVALDSSFPAVRRHHRAVDVDTCGEPLVDERTRQLVRTRIVGHRGQHDYEIRHLLSLAGPHIIPVAAGAPPPPPLPRATRPRTPPRLPPPATAAPT